MEDLSLRAPRQLTPIALLQGGDMTTIDDGTHVIEVAVSDDELNDRASDLQSIGL